MAIIAKLEITNVFADDTTAKVTVDNIKPENINSNIQNIKTTIQNFNSNQGGTLSTKMKSKNGFNWTGIKKAQIIYTDKVILF